MVWHVLTSGGEERRIQEQMERGGKN